MKIKNISWFYVSVTFVLLILLILWGFFLFYSPVRMSIVWAVLLIAVGIFLFYLSTITKYSSLAMIAVLPVLIGGIFLFLSITRLVWRLTVIGLVLLGLAGLAILIRNDFKSEGKERRLSLPGLGLIAVCFFGLLSISVGSVGRLVYLWPVGLIFIIIFYGIFSRKRSLFHSKES